MKHRLTKEEAFKRWNIKPDLNLNLLNILSVEQVGIVKNFISYFPMPFCYKGIGLLIISEKNIVLDATTVAHNICDELYNKVNKTILSIPVTGYILNSLKADSSDDVLNKVETNINSADLVIFNEIAPTEYTDYQKLLIYNLINTCVESETLFIATSNNTANQVYKNLGPLLVKHIITHAKIIQI